MSLLPYPRDMIDSETIKKMGKTLKKIISTVLLIFVTASLMMSVRPTNASPYEQRSQRITITSPTNGSLTGIVVDVEGVYDIHIPHSDGRWWILVSPEDSNLVHPGAPIIFSTNGKWSGTWRGLHSIYLTGDSAQSKQPFRVMIAKVNPEIHQLYVYRLANQIYDYIDIQPGTIIFDHIIVERLL